MRIGKTWWAVAAWNIVLIVGVIAAAEAALRYSSFDSIRNAPAQNPAGYYVADSQLGIRIAPNQPRGKFLFRGPGHDVFSNELGCFDRPARLALGEPYILAIGDSFTWGYNALEDKWTSHLERSTGLRVLKCGVPGTGTRYQLEMLKRLLVNLPHPPATVVHLYDTTDFNDDFIFPGETVADGRRIENYDLVRLNDGHHVPRGSVRSETPSGQIYGERRQSLLNGFVLTNLVKLGLTVDELREMRRSLLQGNRPDSLTWRYQFNLLLLDPEDYPYVSQRLDVHFQTLSQLRNTAEDAGAEYVMFHTNSFRLPADRPMVARLERYLDSVPGYLGRMPELDRHLFDPHWNAESEARVASVMLRRMKAHGYLNAGPRISLRATGHSVR